MYSGMCVCVSPNIHYWTKTKRMDTTLGNVQDLQRSLVLKDDFLVILPDWTSQTCYCHLHSEYFYPFSLGSLVSICMQCSGGLLYQREEHNILLVCLALWHLNKLERCINLAKDWGQSDGWTGIIPHQVSSFGIKSQMALSQMLVMHYEN